jgi:hypothetical protein
MEPFVWNYILEKDLDEEDDSSVELNDARIIDFEV